MTKREKSKTRGISTLVLVFVIASLFAIVLVFLHLIALIGVRRAAQVYHTQQAFFAAEGAMYETLQHLKDDPDWPETPYDEDYLVGEAEVTRTITVAEGRLKIDITATIKGAKRRLIATFTHGPTGRFPLDIILVVDRSGSMALWKDPSGYTPIYYAKQAAKAFVQKVQTANTGVEIGEKDRVGLVSYGSRASEPEDLDRSHPLTENYGDVVDQIDTLPDDGIGWEEDTNMAQALEYATSELQTNPHPNPEAIKVIIFLSDGVAYVEEEEGCDNDGNYSDCRCIDSDCLHPDSGFEPDDQGNLCSQDAINEARVAKNENGDTIFSILLTNFKFSSCSPNPSKPDPDDLQSTIDLGRLTLLRISSEPGTPPLPEAGDNYVYYKETNIASELEEIYEELAETITSSEFFELYEEIPEPEEDGV